MSSVPEPLRGQDVAAGVTLSALTGFGVFMLGIVAGIGFGFLPFLSDGEYPHQDTWFACSVLVGIGSGVALLILSTLGRPRATA